MLQLDTKVLRERALSKGDLTHEEIARRAGLDRTAVTRFLGGRMPSLPTVTALAWAYGIELDLLIPQPKAEAGPEEVAA